MKPTLLVLAAGMGSRYGGLKQLDAMGPNGETIMDYSVFDAARAGFGRVVFVIRRDIEAAFREHVGSRYEKHIEVGYAFQSLDDLPPAHLVPAGRTKPWGTGQAVYAARSVVSGPFAVINADDFYGFDGYQKLATALASGRPDEYMMCGFYLKNTLSQFGSVSRGICEVSNGVLNSVTEKTKIARNEEQKIFNTLENGQTEPLPEDAITSMNMWGFQDGLFDELEGLFSDFLTAQGEDLKSEFYIPFAIAELVKRKRCQVKVLTSADAWFGVTYQSDKAQVVSGIAELIKTGRYPSNLWGAK